MKQKNGVGMNSIKFSKDKVIRCDKCDFPIEKCLCDWEKKKGDKNG